MERRRRLFMLPKRANLWDSPSEDEEEEPAAAAPRPNVDIIDLSRSPVLNEPASQPVLLPPEPASWPTVEQPHAAVAFVPRTLPLESRRYSILPAFPSSFYNDCPPLLLANVPLHRLDEEQGLRRRRAAFPLPYSFNGEYFDVPSYFRQHHLAFIGSLIYQYNVDEPIVDYNLCRFSDCFQSFAGDCIHRLKYQADHFDLNEKQKKYAFEFYLQIDADLFFMKTCSYRNAKPRSVAEGLFCSEEPDARYGLSPCHNCPLCVPPRDMIMRFGPSQRHRFVNGYQTILNCPADCQTRNIIYVMTCPCGQYDYIGETSQRIGDRLKYHREHWNRIIHEFLIGERNVQLLRTEEKDHETLVKDRMLLYRHAARCPCTIQIFLDFNPSYACFIPITDAEATQKNRNFVLPASLILHDAINPSSIGSKHREAIPTTATTRSDETVRSCIRNIPAVPSGYAFSMKQRVQQFQYFKAKRDSQLNQNKLVDLFNVATVAVLPLDVSDVVRRFVEALFITHTETKLNTFGRLLHINEEPYEDDEQFRDRGTWCRNVVFNHPQPR